MSYSIKLSFLYHFVEPLGYLRFSDYFPLPRDQLGQYVQIFARVAFMALTTLFCLSVNFKFIPIKPIYSFPPLLVVAGAWIMTPLLTPPKKNSFSCISSISPHDPVIRKLDFNTLPDK